MIFLRSLSDTGSCADSFSSGKKNSSRESLILSLKNKTMIRNWIILKISCILWTEPNLGFKLITKLVKIIGHDLNLNYLSNFLRLVRNLIDQLLRKLI